MKFVRSALFLCVVLLSNSLFASNPAAKNERLEKFLKHVMIQHNGIYTLVGSKPMTAFPFAPVIDEEEKKIIYLSQSKQLRQHISLAKFQPSRVDCQLLWREWKELEKHFVGKQYLFVEFEEWEEGLFINIPSVAYVLKKHYADFVKVVKEDFDPYLAVKEIGNLASPFWNRLKKNHYLLGLLLGFGERNALHFQWESVKYLHFIRGLSGRHGALDQNPRRFSIKDISTPGFAKYSVADERGAQYEAEREEIIKLYEGRDFVDFTLSLLRGNRKHDPWNVLSTPLKKSP